MSKSYSHLKVSWQAICVLLSIVFFTGLSSCNSSRNALTEDEKRAEVERMYSEYQKGFPEVPEIETDELAQALKDGRAVLVDVRAERERDVSRIPDSISEEEFNAKRDEYAGRPVVAYCTIGYRSGQFAQQLIADGVDAKNLHGSILGWILDGHPIEDDKGETHRIHVYGPQWDFVPQGYESVW